MFTTVHPIAFAELRQRVWFSFLSQGLRTRFVLMARSSIVPGTATLMSLLHQKPQDKINTTANVRFRGQAKQIKSRKPGLNTIIALHL